MALMEDLQISFLNFNFFMIYMHHNMLVLLKSHWNYLKNSIFECFFKKFNRLLFLFFFNNFFHNIIIESLGLEQENIIKDIRNLFRQEK